ncbi:hypothetical protein [Alkalihalobacillus deserti]|nr:hypothetical protein [Alkalihalobacillus deserti]
MFMKKELKDFIKDRGIQLIGYCDVKQHLPASPYLKDNENTVIDEK